MRQRRALLPLLVSIVGCQLVAAIEDIKLTPGASDGDGGGGGIGDGGSGVSDAGPIGIEKSGVVISPSVVDFGLVECGGNPPGNVTLTLTNNANVARTWTAELSGDPTPAIEIVSGGSGQLAPGGTATITLGAPAVTANTAAGTPYRKLLSISVDDPLRSKVSLPVVMTSSGAQLVLPAGALGEIGTSSQSGPIPLHLYNAGNAAVSVTLGAPNGAGYTVTYTGAPNPVSLGPGQAMPGLIATFSTASGSSYNASVPVQVTGAVCGRFNPTQPISFTISAGSTSSVGALPGAVDFGHVACGAQAAAQNVTFTNYGSTTSWTAALAKGSGSPFAISSTSGSLARNQSVTIAVTPSKVPTTLPAVDGGSPLSVGDTLNFTYTSGGSFSYTRNVELRQVAVGGILKFDRQSIDFGASAVGAQAVQTLRITNTGSIVGVTFAPADPFGLVPGGSNVASGALFATFVPTAPGAAKGSLVPSTSDPLCAPIPPIDVSGTGQ